MTDPSPIPRAALDRECLEALIRHSARHLDDGADAEGAVPAPSHLERLLALAQKMNRIRDRDTLLAYIRDRLSELFDAENSQVILVGRDGSLQVLQREGREARREISETLVRRVVKERVPVLVNDASQDPELHDKQSVLELGLVSVLCAPLVVEGRVLGVIEFDHRNEPKRFSQEDLALLGLFANQAATALDNVLLGERRAEAERRMREAQAQLVATERLRALGQMAAGVAHDFNNLLASILGLSELLLRRPDVPAGMRPTVERLHACARDGVGTVRRIQRFAGAPAGEDGLVRVDLDRVVTQVAESCAPRLEPAPGRPRHRLRREPGDVPAVAGRVADLQDVVRNLVLNALDAMPDGGTVTIRTLERDGRVLLEVEDTGVGIPLEIRDRIFEPFFTTKGGRGRGLGLSVCWGMVERLGGSIDVRPGAEGGTVFVLDLPPAPPGLAEADAEEEAAPREAAPGRRILLVDDDPMVRDVMRCLLASLDHEVVVATSGAEALETLGRAPVDLVITDHGMPGMSGLELAARIRRRRPAPPVVLLTGSSPEGVEADAGDVVALVLGKPVTARELGRAVEQVLGAPAP